MASPQPSPTRPILMPAWWVIGAWVALGVGTVWSVGQGTWGLDRTGTRVLAAVVFGVAAVATLLSVERLGTGARRLPVVVAVVLGLVAVLLAPSGLGEVPVFMAAARIPVVFTGRAMRLLVAVATVATSAVIAYVSHSLAGALAGVAIPFLAQRALDRKELVEQRDRAEALLVEVQSGREAETQAATLRERGRIAHEMHDVLAHSLAGLSLQLQAARAVAQRHDVDPAVLEPIDRAAELARDGLAEAKAAVGALSAPPLRGVAELRDLVRRHPGEVTLDVVGEPLPLAPEADHAAYRAIQESLTNAARYAPGSPVHVVLTWHAAGLGVSVEDVGAAPGHTPITDQGTGLGLPGMRERLSAVGGGVQAGPHGDGWRVVLDLPAMAESAVSR